MTKVKLFYLLCCISAVYALYYNIEDTERRLHLRKLRKEVTKTYGKRNTSMYKRGYMRLTRFGIITETLPLPNFERIHPGFKVELYGPRWVSTNPYFDGMLNKPLLHVDGDIQGYFRKCNVTDMWVYIYEDKIVTDDDFLDFAISVFIFKNNKLDYIVRNKFFVQVPDSALSSYDSRVTDIAYDTSYRVYNASKRITTSKRLAIYESRYVDYAG